MARTAKPRAGRASISGRFGGPTDFSRYIRKRRLELGLTQKEVGRRMGVGMTYISQLENGRKVDQKLGSLHRMAAALKVTTEQLILEGGLDRATIVETEAEDSERDLLRQALIREIDNLNNEEKEDALAWMRHMSAQRRRRQRGRGGDGAPSESDPS